jgi:hypothetical protein
MDKTRTIRTILRNKPTIEGAGVHLKRVFGNSEVPLFDPFLLEWCNGRGQVITNTLRHPGVKHRVNGLLEG